MPGFNSVDGLNSGLKTTEIIDSIIQFERRNTVLLENEQSQKQSIVSALQALQAKFIGLNTSLIELNKSSTFDMASINISDDTIMSVTADGRVGTGTYDLQVLSLARNHQLASQGFDDDSLASMGTGDIKIKVGDGSEQTISIDVSNNSLIGIKTAINNAKIGVTASIVNDGSSSQPYRLILSADKTGVNNSISITSSLTGGSNLNYSSVSFDNPETITMDTSSTSQISLGPTAAYTGTANKIYTFTVSGTGSQTIGTDNITINWTDGTDSGSIVVTQADTEVVLAGNGSDGLKLSFSAGIFNAGDKFQVSTFAPLLQDAEDAQLTVGSSGGSGSPITVTSDTNTFKEVISGLTLTVKKINVPGENITVTTDIDIQGIKSKINAFITSYNDINDYIGEQNKYTEDSESTPVLFGNMTVWRIQNSLRSRLGSKINGITSNFNQLYSIGIRTNSSGKLSITNNSRLEDALRDNLDDVIKLFTDSGNSSSSYVEFVSSTSKTKTGTSFDVDITQEPTQGGYKGADITDPATTPITLDNTDNIIKLKVDGLLSDDIILTEKTYQTSTELIKEIQSKIDNDDKIGNRGLTVKWVSNGTGGGHIDIVNSSYGSTSKIELDNTISNPAFSILGLASGSSYTGQDVEGTINGEEADGVGQYLTGKEGNSYTEGLKLKITIDNSQIVTGAEGNITVSKGVANNLKDYVEDITKSIDGIFDRRITGFQNQIEALSDRIEDNDKRLAIRRESLFKKFYEMEVALGQLNTQSQFLNNQLSGINSNWQVK